MKVYLAGKITGDPNYREKFAEAAKKLEERAGVTESTIFWYPIQRTTRQMPIF